MDCLPLSRLSFSSFSQTDETFTFKKRMSRVLSVTRRNSGGQVFKNVFKNARSLSRLCLSTVNISKMLYFIYDYYYEFDLYSDYTLLFGCLQLACIPPCASMNLNI